MKQASLGKYQLLAWRLQLTLAALSAHQLHQTLDVKPSRSLRNAPDPYLPTLTQLQEGSCDTPCSVLADFPVLLLVCRLPGTDSEADEIFRSHFALSHTGIFFTFVF